MTENALDISNTLQTKDMNSVNKNIAPEGGVYALRAKEYRKLWNLKNKEKMAEYARKYYNKRCCLDPEYKKVLCERKKENNKKNGTTKNKSVGRPPIYLKDEYDNFI
jgi:hypothetical protein